MVDLPSWFRDTALAVVKLTCVIVALATLRVLLWLLNILVMQPLLDPLSKLPGPDGKFFQNHFDEVMKCVYRSSMWMAYSSCILVLMSVRTHTSPGFESTVIPLGSMGSERHVNPWPNHIRCRLNYTSMTIAFYPSTSRLSLTSLHLPFMRNLGRHGIS